MGVPLTWMNIILPFLHLFADFHGILGVRISQQTPYTCTFVHSYTLTQVLTHRHTDLTKLCPFLYFRPSLLGLLYYYCSNKLVAQTRLIRQALGQNDSSDSHSFQPKFLTVCNLQFPLV